MTSFPPHLTRVEPRRVHGCARSLAAWGVVVQLLGATPPVSGRDSGAARIEARYPGSAVAGDQGRAPLRETLKADTAKTTVAGNSFVAPAGWTIWVDGPATIVETPEGDSRLALVDVEARDGASAVARAWDAYRPDRPWPLQAVTPRADRDGWTDTTAHLYATSPAEGRTVSASARFANGTWTVVILDTTRATLDKRGAQVALLSGKLLPRGFVRESFAGKSARRLDPARIAQLEGFVKEALRLLAIPGMAIGIVQDGNVVLARGFGVREFGKPAEIDADTRFRIASVTKPLTTLLIAKLVDEGKLTWDAQAVALLPSFRLGDAATTSKVLVKHLVCACTGMPRRDLQRRFEYAALTPADIVAELATTQPTSNFGELFQYSNPMAATAGFLAGHAAYPQLELGKAYEEAMRTRVFGPLGMTASTFDARAASHGNFAHPHTLDFHGAVALVPAAVNDSTIPSRPAHGAWSTLRDLLRYVQMELAEGKLPDGSRYVAKDVLFARRAPQVAVDGESSYGMGLRVSEPWNLRIVGHGGDIVGFHHSVMWLPEHGVGAVLLSNGSGAQLVRGAFQRKLVELLFDGRSEADAELEAVGKRYFQERAAKVQRLTLPAEPGVAGKLAPRYASVAAGEIAVVRKGASTIFDFGEFQSEVASQRNPDGSTSFVMIVPVPHMEWVEFAVGSGPKRTLILRDAQHEHVFVER